MRKALATLALVLFVSPLIVGQRPPDTPSKRIGATIKKKSGEILTGEILGQIVLRSRDEARETGTRKTVGYIVIPGASVDTIDERGVNPVADATLAIVVHGYYGATPPDTERTLGFAESFVNFVQTGTTTNLQIDGGFVVSPIKGNNLTDPLIGELRTQTLEERQKGGGPPVLIPSIRVKTAEGIVTVPIGDIIAPVAQSKNQSNFGKPKQGNLPAASAETVAKPKVNSLPPATAKSIASGKQILGSVKQAMGGSAIDKITDQTTIANISIRTPQGFVDVEKETTFKLPNKVLEVLTRSTEKVKGGFDGNTNWIVTAKGTQVLPDSARQQRLAILNSDILMILRNYNSEFYTVQALEKSEFEGKLVNVVALTDKSSETTTTLLVDIQTHLPLKHVISGRVTDGAVIEQLLSDYREVGGIKVAYNTTMLLGGLKLQETRLSEVKFNTGVSDSLFSKP